MRVLRRRHFFPPGERLRTKGSSPSSDQIAPPCTQILSLLTALPITPRLPKRERTYRILTADPLWGGERTARRCRDFEPNFYLPSSQTTPILLFSSSAAIHWRLSVDSYGVSHFTPSRAWVFSQPDISSISFFSLQNMAK